MCFDFVREDPLLQVLTCYSQGKGTADDPVGPGARADCPCTGVRDSHYDNSCAEAHACAAVKVLSPQQTGCGGGGPEPGPAPPGAKCTGGAKCCPGVKGPQCAADADCEGQSGCLRCAHSGHCTDEPLTVAAAVDESAAEAFAIAAPNAARFF